MSLESSEAAPARPPRHTGRRTNAITAGMIAPQRCHPTNRRNVLLEVELEVSRLPLGTHRTSCPVCDRGKRDTAFACTKKSDGSTVGYCHRCQATGWLADQDRPLPMIPRPIARKPIPERPIDHDRLQAVLADFDRAQPITAAAPVGRYLIARRWLPSRRHLSGWTGPCMIALATDALTGEPRTVHRTWIDPSRPGHKAPLCPQVAHQHHLDLQDLLARMRGIAG